MSLRVLIADDERLARERLKRFLSAESSTEIVAECASGSEALAAIRAQAPDVAFLDVRMPGLDAFAILDALAGQRLPAIILVTAFDHFALRAFDIEAVDYLLKPFNRQRVQRALYRVRNRLQIAPAGAEKSKSPQPIEVRSGPPPLDRLTVRSYGRITLIKPAEVDWISSSDNYVELHVGTKVHLLRESIAALSARLAENRFARISRSILVNLDRIRETRSKSHGDYFVILDSGVTLVGSRNYRLELDKLLNSR